MKRLLVLPLFFLPALTVAQQPFSCDIREIARVADAHLLTCDGVRSSLSAEDYAAQRQEGANLLSLCPPGTLSAGLAGHAVQFDTPSGEAEVCDMYKAPNNPSKTNIFGVYDEITLDTATDLGREQDKPHQARTIPGLTLLRGRLTIHEKGQVPR